MNSIAKDAWIDLLLCGRYRQRRDVLHKSLDNSFSAYGLLCEAHRRLTGAGRWVAGHSTMSESLYVVGDYANDWYLPSPVWDWAGFPDRRGDGLLLPISIIKLNAEMDFEQIAREIRRHL